VVLAAARAGRQNSRQLGRACPKLKSDPKHGTWGYYLSQGTDPKTGQRLQFRKTGFRTKAAAASAVAELKHKLDKGSTSSPRTAR
jgi:Arm DNA-binding domain